MKILIVEDDQELAGLIAARLRNEALEPALVRSGESALVIARTERPDLVLLDLQLPGRHGLDLCREIRADAALASIPILMMTGLGEEVDRIVGLEVGADDYVVKPFSVRELVLRVKAILRRSRGHQPSAAYRVGTLQVDAGARRVVVGERPIALTRKEFDLLHALASARGRVLTREHLLQTVWEYQHGDIATRTVDVHVRQLRRKLQGEAWRVETVERVGYRLNPQE